MENAKSYITSDHGMHVKITLHNDQLHASNVYIKVESNMVGIFRIHYTEETKYNHTTRTAWDVYFEPHMIPEGNYSHTYNVKHVTDICLFLERHKQNLLERIFRQLMNK